MVSILNRMLSLAGIVGGEEEAWGDGYAPEEEYPQEEDRVEEASARAGGSQSAGGERGGKNLNNVVSFNAGAQQKNPANVLVSAKPERFSDAQAICEHLKERHIVIFNLEDVDPELAQKIVDFFSGAVFALDAEILKFSRNLFGVAPGNVDLIAIKEDPKGRGLLSFGGYKG